MTLGGMMKHLAFVEDYWFGYVLSAQEPTDPWASVDWDAEPDWDWESAGGQSLDELRELWATAVDRSRVAAESAYATGGLCQLALRERTGGTVPNLRWILLHMIAEYARHNGHADLIRESIDGRVGE